MGSFAFYVFTSDETVFYGLPFTHAFHIGYTSSNVSEYISN